MGIFSSEFILSNFTILFWICLGWSVITSLLMAGLAKRFYTSRRIKQRFSIFDLQFAPTSQDLVNIITGIDKLPDPGEVNKSKNAVRAHLIIDFFFMPAMYGMIALLCYRVSWVDFWGTKVFIVLAVVQVLPWLLDVSENVYLLRKIRSPEKSAYWIHQLYSIAVVSKWMLASSAAAAALSLLCFLWMTGQI